MTLLILVTLVVYVALFAIPVYQKRTTNRERIVKRMWMIRALEGQWLEFTCVRVIRGAK